MDLKAYIRDIPDFPEEGILFRDITPLLGNPTAFDYSIVTLVERYRHVDFDAIIAVESRGFLFAAPLARELRKPLVLVRKAGKLPYETHSTEYTLEYGSNTIEMHVDGISPGQRVLIVDDLLATGGTLAATAELVETAGGVVTEFAVLIELTELGGRNLLGSYGLFSIIEY